MRIALILGVLIALGSTARAGSEVGVVVTGESWIQPQITAQLEGWLTQHGHSVTPLPPDALDALRRCFTGNPDPRDLSCARGVVDRLPRPSRVIYTGVDARNAASGTPDLTLTAVWFDKGHEAVGRTQTCARCTDQSLRAAADDLLKHLVGGTDPGHVKLKSAPPGATISIDGKAIGVAPLDWDLPPGKHTIQMDKVGLRPATRDIEVSSNQSDLVVLTLGSDAGDDSDRGIRLPRWVPLTATIAGGAVLATGIVLIAVDQDPSKTPTPRQYYYDTAPLGVGLAIGGAVVGGVGAYLLWRSPRPTSAPVAALTRDTAYIGWLGRF